MPQDAYTLRHVARELCAALSGGKVNKIIQPSRDEIDMLLYAGGRTQKLLLNTNASYARAALSDAARIAPAAAPNFCMLLRKHLLGAVLESVEQIAFERILAFTFDCTGEFSRARRVLYAEIMGKYSNLILTENGVISGALKVSSVQENFKRTLFPGARYLFPEPQDKADARDIQALEALFSAFGGGDLARFLFESVGGLAYSTAALICESAHISDPAPPFDGAGAKAFAQHVHDFIFSEEVSPAIQTRDGAFVDFHARYAGGIPFDSVNAAQDAFYTDKETARDFTEKRRKLESLLNARRKKEEKKLALLVDRERECANIEKNRVFGELLTANLYALKKGAEGCELLDYTDENCPLVKIPLDKTLSPAQNAQKYYKKYNKQKRTLAAVAPQRAETESELDYIFSALSSLARAETCTDLVEIEEELKEYGLIKAEKGKKKPPKEAPFRTFSFEGFTIFAGRNNVQNDRLLKESAPEDLWFHTQKYHSSHVIVKSGRKEVPDGVKLFAAEVCAYFSDAKAGDKIPVDFCERKFVKKPSKSRAGFVVYTNFSTMLVTPDRHADRQTGAR